MYGRKPVVNSDDDDSDFGSRYKSSYGPSSARGSSSRDMDSFNRDSRDRFSRDSRNPRESDRTSYSRDPHFDTRDSRDTRDSKDIRGSRDNMFTRDSRDNFSRDTRDRDTYNSRDRDFKRDQSFNRDMDKSDSYKFDSYRNGLIRIEIFNAYIGLKGHSFFEL